MKKFLIFIVLLNLMYAGFLDTPRPPIPPINKNNQYINQGSNEIIYTNDNLGEKVTVPPATEEIMDNSLGEPIGNTPENFSIEKNNQIENQNISNSNNNVKNFDTIKEVNVEDYRNYGSFKIALLVPKKVIGSYANKVSNAILSYFILKGRNFEYEVFDSKDESVQNLIDTLFKIKSKGYNFVIAPLTKKGAELVTMYEKDMIIYIPTINKQDIEIPSGNIIYGGIDYRKQIDKLLEYTNDKLAIFSGTSEVANRLTSYIYDKRYDMDIYTKVIKNSKVNPKWILKNNNHLQNASIFFNLPLVTSALIISSFSSYNIKPYGVFTTQINYSPLLFNMIQAKDRQNLYIANSIRYINSKLIDINKNFGNSIKYDWVVYSSSIGLDYIYSKFFDIDQIFFENIVNHQVKYKTKIVKIQGNEFKRVDD